MSDGRRDAQFGAQEGGAKLCDKFLARVGFTPSPAGEVAVQARGMSGPVRLMPISA